jgi:hypothetical protein
MTTILLIVLGLLAIPTVALLLACGVVWVDDWMEREHERD